MSARITPMTKLFSWNVNGIRAALRKDALAPFIKETDPDILGIQETKTGAGHEDIELTGYHQYWNSAERPGYSGTAIFSKEKPISVINGFPEDFAKKYNFIDHATRDAATEGRLITAEFDNFYFVTVYTPNAKDDLSRIPLRHEHWDPAFLAYLKDLEKTKPVVACGDLNVAHTPDDLARPKENDGKKGFTKEEREGFQNLVDAGFIDTFRMFTQGNGHYTYWSQWAGARARNVGWRIDYFFVSSSLKDKVKKAEILPQYMGSDHCPISLELTT
jgi:exodeoxyribonuclease-3